MCKHEWEYKSSIEDKHGDLYIIYRCYKCCKIKQEIYDNRRY